MSHPEGARNKSIQCNVCGAQRLRPPAGRAALRKKACSGGAHQQSRSFGELAAKGVKKFARVPMVWLWHSLNSLRMNVQKNEAVFRSNPFQHPQIFGRVWQGSEIEDILRIMDSVATQF